jgi:hypothetical protein
MTTLTTNLPPGVLARYKEVAVTGAGLIGISWAALFLANGLRVRVYDPRPDLEKAVRDGVTNASQALRELGYSTDGVEERLRIESNLEAAASDADLVQESGPENIDFKRTSFAELEEFVKPDDVFFYFQPASYSDSARHEKPRSHDGRSPIQPAARHAPGGDCPGGENLSQGRAGGAQFLSRSRKSAGRTAS